MLATLTLAALAALPARATEAPAASGAVQLIMVEEAGCIWCARWNTEISEIYPKTPEGQAAPLRRIDIRDRRPDGIDFSRPLTFTPTFVLVVDGAEVARIEGYPGEDFFWGLLKMHLTEHAGFTGGA
uniref:Sulfur/thiosulfate oxidation protein SoxS n=1 Tax=uncultured bacterium ws101A12 TaxID=1131826 RepID=I1X4E6_9BACT|nr:sulfur/thiosulfate oxidation protein SoxS [uncultured bacterium ws101A12]